MSQPPYLSYRQGRMSPHCPDRVPSTHPLPAAGSGPILNDDAEIRSGHVEPDTSSPGDEAEQELDDEEDDGHAGPTHDRRSKPGSHHGRNGNSPRVPHLLHWHPWLGEANLRCMTVDGAQRTASTHA